MPKTLNEDDLTMIKTLVDHGLSTKEIVKLTGWSRSTVDLIKSGKREQKLERDRRRNYKRKHPDDDTQEEIPVESVAPSTDFEDRLIAVLESIRDELHTLAIALS